MLTATEAREKCGKTKERVLEIIEEKILDSISHNWTKAYVDLPFFSGELPAYYKNAISDLSGLGYEVTIDDKKNRRDNKIGRQLVISWDKE